MSNNEYMMPIYTGGVVASAKDLIDELNRQLVMSMAIPSEMLLPYSPEVPNCRCVLRTGTISGRWISTEQDKNEHIMNCIRDISRGS